MWYVEGPVVGSSYTLLGMMNLQMDERRAREKVRPPNSLKPLSSLKPYLTWP